MTDIVERLRLWIGDRLIDDLLKESADEIERLRKRLSVLENAKLTQLSGLVGHVAEKPLDCFGQLPDNKGKVSLK